MNIQEYVGKSEVKWNISSWKKNLPARGTGFKRKEVDAEVERQFEIRSKRRAINALHDPLSEEIETRNKRRFEKIKENIIKHASFAGNYYCRDKGDMREVEDADWKSRIFLICASGWCQYSRKYGTYINMSGLVIWDPDNKEYHFLRVPPDTKTIEEGLESLKPAAVKKAELEGKTVIRQGDVYFIPQKRWNMNAISGTNHEWNKDLKTVTHNQHGKLFFTQPHKAVLQKTVSNGKNNFRYSD